MVRKYPVRLSRSEKRQIYRTANLEKVRAQEGATRKANPEHYRAYAAAYYIANKEHITARNLAWTRANTEKQRAQAKRYREATKTRIAAARARYKRENKGRVNALTRKRQAAQLQRTPMWADHEAITAVYEQAAACGMDVDHVFPLHGRLVSGLHVHFNLQLLPPVENQRKGNRCSV